MAERSTGPRQSDEEILASLDAAPDAIAVFYRRHAGALLSHLERRTQDPALAADLCAETFAAILDSAHRSDPRAGSAAAGLYTTADNLLAHYARRGAAQDRTRRRLGLAPLAAGATFLADLQEEVVEAARYRARRRAGRPALPRPSPGALRGAVAGAAALALVVVAAGLLLRGGDDETAAGDRGAAPPPPATVRFRLLPMQPLAICPQPVQQSADGNAIPGISLLDRPQRDADALPFAAGRLPIGTFDPRSTRRATHTRLWSAVHVVPSLDVAADGECGAHVGPGLCLVADEDEFRCFTAADVAWGRAVARTSTDTLVGIVPDGVERVTVRGIGPPVSAEVVDNVYEARTDVPARSGIELTFDGAGGEACRRTITPELLAEVALLRNRTQPRDRLPGAAREALAHWRLDAVVEEGARYWGGAGPVDFWAVPVVPRGRAGCAPASRVCVVAANRVSSAAQCVLGRNRGGQNWWLGGAYPDRSLIFGTVPDGVTEVRVTHAGETAVVDAHDNVFGGVLPFRYRPRDVPRVKPVRGRVDVGPLIGIVDAGGPVDDIVGRLQGRGYDTLYEITPGGTLQPRSIVYWWPGRESLEQAYEVADAAGVRAVEPIRDTDRIPRPVLDANAPIIVVVGGR
jgi:Sigma-70 region 2